MDNFLISVQLTRLEGVGRVLLKGKDGKKIDCLAIPIEKNFLSISQTNEVYLNAVAWSNDSLKNGQTHLLKQSYPKEIADKMTIEQKRAVPIIGNVKPMLQKRELETYSLDAPGPDEGPDLPF